MLASGTSKSHKNAVPMGTGNPTKRQRIHFAWLIYRPRHKRSGCRGYTTGNTQRPREHFVFMFFERPDRQLIWRFLLKAKMGENMKHILKLIAVGALCVPIGPGAYAISIVTPNCCSNSCTISCSSVTYDSRCEDNTFCTSCNSTTRTNNYGIVVTTGRRITTTCNNCHVTPSCSITSTTYKCASGYYGTATSATSGCTKCPTNATCAGGNGSTYVCNKGTYKTSSGCESCPSPGTSPSGSTSISSCYIPLGTTGSDGSGTYKYTANCYY